MVNSVLPAFIFGEKNKLKFQKKSEMRKKKLFMFVSLFYLISSFRHYNDFIQINHYSRNSQKKIILMS